MGFEPTNLRDLVGCSNPHWATGGSMVSKGHFVGLDWNRITRLHNQVMTGTQELWVQSHLGLGFFFWVLLTLNIMLLLLFHLQYANYLATKT